MDALRREGGAVALRSVPRPEMTKDDDVLVRVVIAGICRTDLLAAEGQLPAREGVILGHELAGVVEAVGPRVRRVAAGAHVTVEPLLPCEDCAACRIDTGRCLARRTLGVDRDGAFATFLRVPEHAVHELPRSMPFRTGAYVEPVAAAAAVADLPLPRARGVVLGRGRIATLTARVLELAQHDVDVRDPSRETLAAGAYAFAVDTVASEPSIRLATHAVERRGTLVLRSRDRRPVPIALGDLVAKELRVLTAMHAPFASAIAMLEKRPDLTGGLEGETFTLAQHGDAFALARASEAQKVFFAIDPERA